MTRVVHCAQPGNGADCAGNEQKPVGILKLAAAEHFSERGYEHHAREIVVGERRMTEVAGEQDLLGARPGK